MIHYSLEEWLLFFIVACILQCIWPMKDKESNILWKNVIVDVIFLGNFMYWYLPFKQYFHLFYY
jgi:hypothetical protein